MSPLRYWMLASLVLVGHNGAEPQGSDRRVGEYLAPGDYIIGGLFPIYSSKLDLQSVNKSEHISCESFYPQGYHWLQAMRFAIEEINNGTELLPGVRLGYEIYNTCFESTVAIESAIALLSNSEQDSIEVTCNYTEYNTRVVAAIGPSQSELSIVVARLFSFLLLPQVSYASSSNVLSNRRNFPSFFRTIPTDEVQADAMASIVYMFQWNWIAIIGTDNDYGRQGIELFSVQASKRKICVAYEDLIPLHLTGVQFKAKLVSIVNNINYSKINVTIVFCDDRFALALIDTVLQLNITGKVWIASEGWVTSTSFQTLTNVASIGTILGVAVKTGNMPGFDQYVLAEDPGSCINPTPTEICHDSKKLHTELAAQDCLSHFVQTHNGVVDTQPQRITFNVYSAVYAVAHALHALLECDSGSCKKKSIYPWQLLETLAQVNFTLNGHDIYFTPNGDPPTGYDIVNWHWNGKDQEPEFRKIGEYRALWKELDINVSQIQWNTPGNQWLKALTDNKETFLFDFQIPVSNCSTSCKMGQVRMLKGYQSCCYECVDCPKNTFQNQMNKCIACRSDQWSKERSVECHNKSIAFLEWTDSPTIVLSTMAVLALLVIISAVAIFIVHFHTPIVQFAGGSLCFVMLVSLAISCCSIFCFVGCPTQLSCTIRQPIFNIGFTGCLSVMLTRAFQVGSLCGTSSIPPTLCPKLIIASMKYLVVAFIIMCQAALCTWQFSLPPTVLNNYNVSETQIVVECSESSLSGFGLLVAYNALLGLACFLCTFMGQRSGQAYNLARCIMRSTLIYFAAWIFFIPTYTSFSGKLVPCIQMSTGMISIYGILVAYFIPKCYIILFKPEYNTQSNFQSSPDNLSSKEREQ
ncbi:taste receptor type 1 member 3 [Callorhinchus milii]|uniref:taste receptor type 1 member 3 n=1 Tax=Callorhinchus milii TaxID=7868 RepID=UPI001C3FA7D5|nr:taste receptor type 1 member 3 [Callorhinchus milii]